MGKKVSVCEGGRGVIRNPIRYHCELTVAFLLWRGINDLPASVVFTAVWPLHPHLVPHVEIPETLVVFLLFFVSFPLGFTTFLGEIFCVCDRFF